MVIEFRGDEAGERLLPNAYLCNDNPTNGDIMWAIFPKVEIYTDVMNEIVDVEICEDKCKLRCSADWWDAPYKRGSDTLK